MAPDTTPGLWLETLTELSPLSRMVFRLTMPQVMAAWDRPLRLTRATELHGDDLAGNANDTFVVRELQTDLGGGQFLIQAEIIALDSGNARVDWVAAGQTGPNGIFTSWRIDVGGIAAAANLINPDGPFTLLTSGVEVFDLAGGSLGAFGLLLDLSDSTGLGGVGGIGLGGADIGGAGVSSLQVFFTVQTQTVPEPASAGLISLMGCGLALSRRRKL